MNWHDHKKLLNPGSYNPSPPICCFNRILASNGDSLVKGEVGGREVNLPKFLHRL